MIDWAELGTAVMRDARKSKGYSYETIARELNVAAKTYERYEKAGRVPRQMLRRVAEVLDLEIEWPRRTRVALTAGFDQETAREMLAATERIEAMLRDLLAEPRDGSG